MQSLIEAANIRAQKSEAKHNDTEQYSRNYNLRFYFVEETTDETPQQCEKVILQLLHDKLGLTHITAKDIDAAHRLGKKSASSTPRAIIVCFTSRKTRNEVVGNRRKLKKASWQTSHSTVIVEDLTKENYILYSRARQNEKVEHCWTKFGKVFVKTKTGFIKQIKVLADLDNNNLNLNSRPSPKSSQTSNGRKMTIRDYRKNEGVASGGRTVYDGANGRLQRNPRTPGPRTYRTPASQTKASNVNQNNDDEWESQSDSGKESWK